MCNCINWLRLVFQVRLVSCLPCWPTWLCRNSKDSWGVTELVITTPATCFRNIPKAIQLPLLFWLKNVDWQLFFLLGLWKCIPICWMCDCMCSSVSCWVRAEALVSAVGFSLLARFGFHLFVSVMNYVAWVVVLSSLKDSGIFFHCIKMRLRTLILVDVGMLCVFTLRLFAAILATCYYEVNVIVWYLWSLQMKCLLCRRRNNSLQSCLRFYWSVVRSFEVP